MTDVLKSCVESGRLLTYIDPVDGSCNATDRHMEYCDRRVLVKEVIEVCHCV